MHAISAVGVGVALQELLGARNWQVRMLRQVAERQQRVLLEQLRDFLLLQDGRHRRSGRGRDPMSP